MVEFKRLHISPDGKFLVIKAAVKDEEYFENVYIKSVTIDTQDTFVKYGPSDNPIYYKEYPEPSDGDTESEDTAVKKIYLKISQAELTECLNKNLFFVYVSVQGTPAADTPCGGDCINTLGVVFNLLPIYQTGFNYIKELAEDCGTCKISKTFIDFILRLKAFQVALKTSHYLEAINFWKKYIYKEISSTITKSTGCGCNR